MAGGVKNTNAAHLSADSVVVPHSKLYKNEDIPLTISGSLMRTRTKTSSAHEPIDQYDSNESNDDNCGDGGGSGGGGGDDDGSGDSDYTYSNPHSNPTIIHYSTMSANARDYFRKTAGHLHRGVNNNGMIPANNCYRWHNQSDEVVLHSLRNNSMTIAAPTKAKAKAKANAMVMHPNHRTYNYPDRRELQQHKQQQQHHQQKQQQHQQNHMNNNCIVSNNKKQSIMLQNTHNNQNSVDQNNGNQYPPRLYH